MLNFSVLLCAVGLLAGRVTDSGVGWTVEWGGQWSGVDSGQAYLTYSNYCRVT